MASAMTKCPEDAPVMVAWRKYQGSEEYQNTKNWLTGARSPTEGEGELWAAFYAGFAALGPVQGDDSAWEITDDRTPERNDTRRTLAEAAWHTEMRIEGVARNLERLSERIATEVEILRKGAAALRTEDDTPEATAPPYYSSKDGKLEFADEGSRFAFWTHHGILQYTGPLWYYAQKGDTEKVKEYVDRIEWVAARAKAWLTGEEVPPEPAPAPEATPAVEDERGIHILNARVDLERGIAESWRPGEPDPELSRKETAGGLGKVPADPEVPVCTGCGHATDLHADDGCGICDCPDAPGDAEPDVLDGLEGIGSDRLGTVLDLMDRGPALVEEVKHLRAKLAAREAEVREIRSENLALKNADDHPLLQEINRLEAALAAREETEGERIEGTVLLDEWADGLVIEPDHGLPGSWVVDTRVIIHRPPAATPGDEPKRDFIDTAETLGLPTEPSDD